MMNNRVYLGLLILGTAFWGISFPLVKEGLSVVQPHVFLIYRFLLAAIVLSIIFFKYLSKINFTTIKYGVMLAVPLMSAITLQTVCLQYTSSSNAAFIAGMDVLLIPIFKFFLFKKSVQSKTWIACFIALTGLYIIAMSSATGFGYGDVLAVLGAIAFAVYILMVAKFSNQKIETPSLVIVQMYACAAFALVMALFTSAPSELLLPMNAYVWKAVLFTGILATAYMYTMQNISQKYLEEEKIALTYLCEPVFATFAAYFLIGEDITSRTIIGGGLILLALFISEYRFRHLPKLKQRTHKL
jgi:drug/metabolite transporter (DMT)-like permease